MAQTELWCYAAVLVMKCFVTGLSTHEREAIQLPTSLGTDPIEPFPPTALDVRVVDQLASRMIGLVRELGDVNQNLPTEARTGMTDACEVATETLRVLLATASGKEKFGAMASKPDAEHAELEAASLPSVNSFSVDRGCSVIAPMPGLSEYARRPSGFDVKITATNKEETFTGGDYAWQGHTGHEALM